MRTVNTVKGPVDASSLGFTLMHEHVFLLAGGVRWGWPQLFDRHQLIDQVRDRLAAATQHGVDTIVDMTTVDLGRDVVLLDEILANVPLNVVVPTGAWVRIPRYFEWCTLEAATELFIHDITTGIQGTPIKAGVIKASSQTRPITGLVEKTFKAAARAQLATGVPISTHSNPLQQTGLEEQRILKEEGVDLSRVIVGHSGDTSDLGYLLRILEGGSYLGMDRFGLENLGDEHLASSRERIQMVAALCARGYSNRIVLSCDAPGFSDSSPSRNFTEIPSRIVPALREAGVTDDQINQMTRINPQAILGI